MIEIELAIYGTADWHSYRAKILAKIEEVNSMIERKSFGNSFSFSSSGSS
jgi:hypothetical protein